MMTEMLGRKDRKFKSILVLSFALVFALYLSSLNPELSDLSGDSARFLLLAKALAQGKGYREIEKPSEPPHTEYMPGLPILLALFHHFSPKNLIPMKFLIVLFAFGSIIFFYLLLFRETRGVRFALTMIFSLLPFLLLFQTQILSDLPHLFFLLLAFYWFERIREKSRGKEPVGWQDFGNWALAGFLFALAFYFRQLALLGFASGILVLLLTKNLRRIKIIFSYGIGFILPASVWYLRNFLVAGAIEPSYGQKLWFAKASNPFAGSLTVGGLLARIIRRCGFFSWHLEKELLLGSSLQALTGLWVFLLILLLLGFSYELVKKKNIGAIYFLPYLLVISSWEGWVPRYLLPLLPFSLFFISRGFLVLLNLLSKNQKITQGLTNLFLSLWLGWNLTRIIFVINFQHTPLPYPPFEAPEEKEAMALLGVKNFAYFPEAFEWKKKGEQYLIAKSGTYYHFLAMAEWVKRNLKPEEVVVCRKPRLFAWFSEGKAIQLPAELDAEKFIAEIKKQRGNYLLIEEISPELRPLLFQFWESHPQKFILKKQIAQTYLLKVDEREFQSQTPDF